MGAGTDTTGAVLSILIVNGSVGALPFPATSVALRAGTLGMPSFVTVKLSGQPSCAKPERASLQRNSTSTSFRYQPAAFGWVLAPPVTVGGVRSMSSVTMLLLGLTLPALSTACFGVDVWSRPSWENTWSSGQVDTPEVASAHVKWTVTGLLYQPKRFGSVVAAAVLDGGRVVDLERARLQRLDVACGVVARSDECMLAVRTHRHELIEERTRCRQVTERGDAHRVECTARLSKVRIEGLDLQPRVPLAGAEPVPAVLAGRIGRSD